MDVHGERNIPANPNPIETISKNSRILSFGFIYYSLFGWREHTCLYPGLIPGIYQGSLLAVTGVELESAVCKASSLTSWLRLRNYGYRNNFIYN